MSFQNVKIFGSSLPKYTLAPEKPDSGVKHEQQKSGILFSSEFVLQVFKDWAPALKDIPVFNFSVLEHLLWKL